MLRFSASEGSHSLSIEEHVGRFEKKGFSRWYGVDSLRLTCVECGEIKTVGMDAGLSYMKTAKHLQQLAAQHAGVDKLAWRVVDLR
jgi:hypothetical protein